MAHGPRRAASLRRPFEEMNMLTRKQAAEQRRALMQYIDRDHRKKERAKVQGLWQKLREVRAHKKERMKELVERCRSERLTIRERLKEMRARVLQDLRETARVERDAARQACLLRKGDAKTSCGSAIECARTDYHAERTYQADLRRIERDNRSRHVMARKHATRAERRGESDDEVRQNVPRELVSLFERVKKGIKASARMSRTEAFLKYAEEHPHEVFEVIEEKTERMIRDLERKHEEAAREVRRPRRAAPRPQYSREELAAVPF
jgi:hypothetical protein